MAKFKDRLDREWTIDIHRGLLRPLREAGFDLNKILKDATAWDCLQDLDVQGQVFWVLCEEEAKNLAMTPDDFARRFDGPTITAAFDALTEAVLTFFQRPAVAKVQIEKLPAVMKKVEAIEIAKILSGSNESAANLPASPASIPDG